MKMRNKGKVHPSPSSTSNRDTLSVLNLLPAAILAIASVLSLEDREVLAYMVTRSLKPTTPSPNVSKKKFITHKSPVFYCECFDCYTSYWFKWDSSPNRELIHQAIEAFEEHLSSNEHYSNTNRNNKKRDKISRRSNGIVKSPSSGLLSYIQEEIVLPHEVEDDFVRVFPEVTDFSPENGGNEVEEKESKVKDVVVPLPETTILTRGTATNGGHKGLARKVLPDVLGLFNSRLWNLWSPNV
ncbi:uncharacterized protein [Nicotiana tomentosiformis]|uniref:uncharacterized protein n=1 Tax=Nicotiana tomentosiformis TaxID=4098 RepID=UPI00051C12E2|nr:uncharacterized protein LOC104104712 [Nicotiana tomentosiformis]